MKSQEMKSKITIGMPVYNGADTIKRALDSILAQTYSNFELIISDNGSTDSTTEICIEYEQKDKRVKYIKKNKTVSWIWNFIFLVDQAKTEYFMWASDDDYWDPCFIEKNILFLESHTDFIGCVSNVQHFGKYMNNYISSNKKENIDDLYLKFNFVRSIIGTYNEKVSSIIEFNWILNLFSIFRTDILKQGLVRKIFVSWDYALILNLIKNGNMHVLDEVLWYRDSGGNTSSKSFLESLKYQKYSLFGTYFPYVHYTVWCMKNLGLKIFLKNFSHFWYLNTHTAKKIIREIIINIIIK